MGLKGMRRQTRQQRRQLKSLQAKMLGQRALEAQKAYRTQTGWKQDPTVAAAPKKIASRYYQLKVDHAAIETYLKGIRVQDTEACRGCRAPKESVHHLLFECRNGADQGRAYIKLFGKPKWLFHQ
jgi:hypothetical protein